MTPQIDTAQSDKLTASYTIHFMKYLIPGSGWKHNDHLNFINLYTNLVYLVIQHEARCMHIGFSVYVINNMSVLWYGPMEKVKTSGILQQS